MSAYKGHSQQGEIEILEEKVVFRNACATLNNDIVRFPSGTTGEYLRFHWNAPYGVMVFARDEQGRLLLINNFRHETRAWHWEIPKGVGIEGVAPLECAQAELREETGYTATGWALFREFKRAGQITYLYQCQLSDVTKTEQEHSEAIDGIRLFTPEDCNRMLLDDSQVNDPATLFLMAYLQRADS